ncbi:MAG TPA: hypothetical protein VK447_14795, partial [Myxococcaceae bacterium]|nr:hypothetical protein [Myxococcaceae bacterium]
MGVRSWAGIVSVLLFLGASGASAQTQLDGGWVPSGTGFVIGPAYPRTFEGRALYVDAQGRVLVRPFTANGYSGEVRCYDLASGQDLGPAFDPYYAYYSYTYALAVGPNRTDAVVLQAGNYDAPNIQFYRGGCGATPRQALGGFALGQYEGVGFHTQMTTMPMLANGDVLYPSGDGDLIRVAFGSGTAVRSTVISRAGMDAVLGPIGQSDGDGGTRHNGLGYPALVALANDHVLVVAERTLYSNSNSERYHWLVDIDPATGTATILRGPETGISGINSIVYGSSLDAMFANTAAVRVGPGAPLQTVAVIPRSTPTNVAAPIPSWPALPEFQPYPQAPPWRYLMGSATGQLFATETDSYAYTSRVSPLVVDRSLADFDRDGLRATEEDVLGTSDYAADTDGDGVADGLEARLYRTSPTNAADVPNLSAQANDTVLAPTYLPGSWPLSGIECRLPPGLSARGALCVACGGTGSGDYQCFAADGRQLTSTPLTSAQVPRLTPDLTHAWRRDPSAGTWVQRNLATGVEQTSAAITAGPVRDLLPLSKDVVLVTEGNPPSGYAEKLFRYSGGNRFAVVDVTRAACPIVGNVDGLARCGTPEARIPGIMNVWLVGWDAARKMALVKVATQHGRLLLGVGETDAVLLTNLVVPGEKLNVGTAFTLPTGGYVLQLQGEGGAGYNGTRRLDEAFRPVDGLQRLLDSNGGDRFGGWFKHGFYGTEYDSYLVERGTSAGYAPFAFATEWAPVTPALEKGEVLFWTGAAYRPSVPVAFRDRDGRYVDASELTAPGWRLWRLNPVGAVMEWLEARDFVAKLDAAGLASVARAPLGPITAMGASADALRICLAEPTAGRVWELSLDGATRRLATITVQEPQGGVSACGYDDQGRLAILSAAPVSLRVGGATLPVAGMASPVGLIRFPGRWVVLGDGETARCLADDGTLFDSGVRPTAASEALGGLAYLDGAGHGFLARVDGFCGAGPAGVETLSDQSNVWGTLYRGLTSRQVTAPRAAMAVRPDGVMVVGAPAVQFGGFGQGGQLQIPLVFYYFPTYRAASCGSRLPEADPFRASEARGFIAARKAIAAESMVLLPGAPPGTDFGHY